MSWWVVFRPNGSPTKVREMISHSLGQSTSTKVLGVLGGPSYLSVQGLKLSIILLVLFVVLFKVHQWIVFHLMEALRVIRGLLVF